VPQSTRHATGRQQLELFATPRPAAEPPAHNRTPTSRQAAEDVTASTPSRRDRVAAFVLSRGPRGATRDEISIALQLPIQSVCHPVNYLLHAGVLIETNRTRLTRYGSPAAVLVRAGRDQA